MELHPNARVLPSNAPALPENGNGHLSTPTNLAKAPSEICQRYNCGNDCSACNLPHVCLRCKQYGHPALDCERSVLRVSSRNVGSSTFESRNTDLKTEDTQKYAFGTVSSLVNPPHHSAQAAIKAEYPRRQQYSSCSSLKGLPKYWRVECQTPRYQAYRKKCREKGSTEIWPDNVEDAFQMAIRLCGRRGRRKTLLNGKLCGGNEFIAAFIFQATGVKRTRKQVSSHIQVLKGFMIDNKDWMRLIADIDEKDSSKKARGSTTREEAAADPENLKYDDGAFDYQPSQGHFPHRFPVPIDILASDVYRGPTIRRVSEFAITLGILKGKRKALRHTCTSIQSETPSAPKALADVNNWRERYPQLAAHHDQGQIDCPIFLFDTHLSLMDLYPSDLGIDFSMDFSQGAHFTDWRSRPSFYEENGRLVDFTHSYPDSEDRFNSVRIEGTDDSRLGPVAFRSKWWVQVFSNMINRKIMMEKNRDPQLIREEEERTRQDVQGISVMLEIWATHRVSKHRRKMAILLWKFSTARREEVATTSWRSLIPPSSVYEIQSPHPPSESPPMTLDTTLQAGSPYVAQPSIFSGCPTDGLPTPPVLEESSQSTTPMAESHSLPSSTSASFPPSVLNSTYPMYPSQESSFHSQDSAYRALGSFDSQDFGYSLFEHHELFEASHESYGSHAFADGSQESYGSQEVIYLSQDSLYEQAPEQLHGSPYQTVDAPVPDPASACQDFTGGQIRLSYAQSEDSQSSYEAPLIAPQANLIPQHQLIQHPEHFDHHDFFDENPGDLVGDHPGLDEQAQVQTLPPGYELNGLTMDYNGWEEALGINPDLERHLSIEAGDEVGKIEQRYMSPVGQEALGSMQGGVVGEIRDEEGTAEENT